MAEHVTEPNAVAGPEPHFIADERELHDVLMRLHRAEGQLHGVVGMPVPYHHLTLPTTYSVDI